MFSYLKKNRLFSIFLFLTLISFIGGILFYALIDNSYKDVVRENIGLLFANKLIDMKTFFFNHLFSNVFIWLLGISVIGFIIIIGLYLFKVFIFSFEFISLIMNLNMKNILMIIAYVFPNLLSVGVLFVLCYYSMSYSIYLFRFLFGGKKYNLSLITKKYFKIFLFTFLSTLICCLMEYFILKHISIFKL